MTARESEGVRVLLVEDDEDDYLIIDEMLADQDRVRFLGVTESWTPAEIDALAGQRNA